MKVHFFLFRSRHFSFQYHQVHLFSCLFLMSYLSVQGGKDISILVDEQHFVSSSSSSSSSGFDGGANVARTLTTYV